MESVLCRGQKVLVTLLGQEMYFTYKSVLDSSSYTAMFWFLSRPFQT